MLIVVLEGSVPKVIGDEEAEEQEGEALLSLMLLVMSSTSLGFDSLRTGGTGDVESVSSFGGAIVFWVGMGEARCSGVVAIDDVLGAVVVSESGSGSDLDGLFFCRFCERS